MGHFHGWAASVLVCVGLKDDCEGLWDAPVSHLGSALGNESSLSREAYIAQPETLRMPCLVERAYHGVVVTDKLQSSQHRLGLSC